MLLKANPSYDICVAFFQENCTYAKIPGTCFMGKTDVELYMKVEKNVYQLGDEIPVHIECTVKGSSKVDRVGTLYVDDAGKIPNVSFAADSPVGPRGYIYL